MARCDSGVWPVGMPKEMHGVGVEEEMCLYMVEGVSTDSRRYGGVRRQYWENMVRVRHYLSSLLICRADNPSSRMV